MSEEYPFRLEERECMRCWGTGVVTAWEGGYTDCRVCWGTGKMEVQRGPRANQEVPDWSDS